MAKPKQRQLVKIPASKNSTPSGPEMDLFGEDSWVMIKKQKVTILIPPLPVIEQRAIHNPEENQPLPSSQKAIDSQSQPITIDPQEHSDSEMEKSMLSVSEKAIPSAPKLPLSQPITTPPNLQRLDHRTMLGRRRVDNITSRKILGVCKTSKVSKRYRSFLNGDASLNQGMRALNLERKLQRAGGLSSWLLSLGLDQFVKIFQGKSVGKFQLANLTMKKLKDMGADAVGPRRKLMHAIDCLCQPYCFEVI